MGVCECVCVSACCPSCAMPLWRHPHPPELLHCCYSTHTPRLHGPHKRMLLYHTPFLYRVLSSCSCCSRPSAPAATARSRRWTSPAPGESGGRCRGSAIQVARALVCVCSPSAATARSRRLILPAPRQSSSRAASASPALLPTRLSQLYLPPSKPQRNLPHTFIYCMTPPRCPSACDRLVEVGGLAPLFALFMGRTKVRWLFC